VQENIYTGILILLAASVTIVWIMRRLQMPASLGYLLTGLVIGPHLLGWIRDSGTIRHLGEFGIVFLLFTLGLEFSLPRLIAMRREVFILGGIQVTGSLAIVATILFFVTGTSPTVAVLLGGAVAMSSTALVAKQLGEQLELRQIHGRLAIGILLFQDLAVIPLLILIPALSTQHGAPWLTLGLVFGKGLAVMVLMFLASRSLIRPLLYEIARHRSSELFLLVSLLITLAAAWATQAMGLSLALGAFVAGVLLAETAYRHQIEADIRPFRDILLGLFFVAVGMYANPRLLLDHAPVILIGTAVLIVFKILIVTGASRLIGVGLHDGLRTGLVLGQGGEFGLALLILGLARGYLSGLNAQLALNILVLSMLVSPFLVRHNARLARRLAPHAPPEAEMEPVSLPQEQNLAGHVILVGYGRIGQNIARFLEEENLDYLALDLDVKRVREAHAGGDPVYYGDATRSEILSAAGLARAKVLVITQFNVDTAIGIIVTVRTLRQDLPILVRTRDDSRMEELRAAGADEIIPETLEASLMISAHLLALLGVPMRRILRRVTQVRSDRYALMRNVYRRGGAEPLDENHAFREQLDAITLPKGGHAIGRKLKELGLEELDVRVNALRREGIVGREPDPETRLRAGDTLVVYGTPENIEQAVNRLLGN